MKKKKIIIIGLSVLIFVVLFAFLLFFLLKEKEKKDYIESLFQDKEVVSSKGDIVETQKLKEKDIEKVFNDSSCTFLEPCVLQNPYEIAPLTALVVFQTTDSAEVKVTINGVFVTTMEASTLHSIPIYGLKENYENEILLEMDGQQSSFTIKTKDLSKNDLTVDIANPDAKLNTDVYFLSGTMGTSAAAYDGMGNLLWYLTPNYTLDMEFLDNGHILLSNGKESGISYTYDGFLEIDYLGKIYNSYSLKNGYHHEIIQLNDGTFMVAGGLNDANAKYSSDFIYRIDAQTGNVLDSLTIYDILAEIDEDFANQLAGTNMICNSVQYNEETDEMIISLRGINTIISVQYKEKKLNWLFGDPSFFSNEFAPFLLEVTDHSRYPKGQHTAYLTEDGKLAVFNNDYDVLQTSSAYLIDYSNCYSSAVIYDIQDKKIHTVWEYDGNKQYFNYALGSFLVNENSKLINFGWSYKPEAYREGVTIYDYIGNTFARIVELNNDDEEIFSATIEEGIYRAYKHKLYEEKTPNYSLVDFTLIDNNDKTFFQEVKTESLFETLDQAIENPYELELTSTTITMNVLFANDEVVDIIFVGEDDDSYIYHYKEKDAITNSKVNLQLDGKYAVYIKINDIVYDTEKILDFS